MPPQTTETLPPLDQWARHAVRRIRVARAHGYAEDLRQTAIVRVLVRTRRSGAMFNRAFVDITARNAAIDHVRTTARRAKKLERNGTWLAHRSRADEVESALVDARVRRAIGAHICALPRARKQVLSLYLSGHGVSEIAQILGCSRKKVDNLVYRGLGTLRERLATDGITPACY